MSLQPHYFIVCWVGLPLTLKHSPLKLQSLAMAMSMAMATSLLVSPPQLYVMEIPTEIMIWDL